MNFVFLSSSVKIVQILKRNMRRRKSTLPVEDKAAKEAAKNKMFATLSKKTGLTAREVRVVPLLTHHAWVSEHFWFWVAS